MKPSQSPLPSVIHQTVMREERLHGGRIIFVGDVQGCADELQELLVVAGFQQGKDLLVFVGNLVSGADSGSARVIRLARTHDALSVRGVTDDDLLCALYPAGERSESHYHSEVSEDDLQWLKERPLTLSIPWLDVLVVHGGLPAGPEFRALAPGSRWASGWEGPQLLIFGHDAVHGLQQHAHAVGLDTGCRQGMALTAMAVDVDNISKRDFFSVFSKKTYSL